MSPLVLDFSTKYEINPKQPLYEATRAIEKICDIYPGPYTLLASGGVDSQAMIYAWKMSGRKFKVVHYSYGTNLEDSETLHTFCAINDIDYEVNYFDVESFINSKEYLDLAIKYDCASPHILTYIKFTSQHLETCIMAGNYISNFSSSLNWTILGLDRFRQNTKYNFIPFFLCSTPELSYSFFNLELMIEKQYSPDIQISLTREHGYMLKVKAYEHSKIPILRQTSKLTGFEEIKEKYDTIKVNKELKLKWALMPSKRTFDLLYRYKLYDDLSQGFTQELI